MSHLQDVLRNWYARLPVVVQNARRLVRQAEKCAEAFRQGELFIHSEVNLVSGLTQHHRNLVFFSWEPCLSIRFVSWERPSDSIYQGTGGRGSALTDLQGSGACPGPKDEAIEY